MSNDGRRVPYIRIMCIIIIIILIAAQPNRAGGGRVKNALSADNVRALYKYRTIYAMFICLVIRTIRAQLYASFARFDVYRMPWEHDTRTPVRPNSK